MTTATTTVYWFNYTVTPTPGYYGLVDVTEDGVMYFEGVDPEVPCDRVELNYESLALYSLEQHVRPLAYHLGEVNLESLLAMHRAAEDLPEDVACQVVRALTGVTSSMECPYYLLGQWVECHTEKAVNTAYELALALPRYHELAEYLAPLP